MRRALTVGATTLLVLACAAPATAESGPSSTTVTLSTTQSVYGQTVTASAAVATVPGPPQGDVVFSLDGTSVKANLSASGTASVVLPKLLVGEHQVTASFVPQFPTDQQGSTSAPQVWAVAQAPTHLGVQVTGRGARIRTSVRVRADGEFGTRPTGTVRVVVQRVGSSNRTRVVTQLPPGGLVVAGIGTLRQGDYRAKVTYFGDGEHLRERRVERFHVRRR
jgi:hypothetical protein